MPRMRNARRRVDCGSPLTAHVPPSPPGASPDAHDKADQDRAWLLVREYRSLEKKQRRLCSTWQRHEAWLFTHRNWLQLTEEEQAALPEADLLRQIEQELEELDTSYDQLVPQLLSTAATTRRGALAKLDALLLFLNPHDHHQAYALVKSCRRDLRRLWIQPQ